MTVGTNVPTLVPMYQRWYCKYQKYTNVRWYPLLRTREGINYYAYYLQ